MAYEVLARKWRPRNFDEVRGQEHVVNTLRNALNLKRLHHAYLFSGTRGVGKTTLARILAKCLDCAQGPGPDPCGQCEACSGIDKGCYPDLIEIDAASRTGVDEMRELLENVPYAPTSGRYKIYLIDEVHMLSTSSFNALLKTLEEPPEHVKFFFATTHPKKIPVTILSRCLQFNLTRLQQEEIEKHLCVVLDATSTPYDTEAVRDLALVAEGSVRDALSLLDQAISYGNGKIDLAETRAMLGLIAGDDVVGLLQSVVAADLGDMFARVDALHKKVADFNGALADLIVLLHEVAVWQAIQQQLASSWFAESAVKELAKQMTAEDVQLFYQLALNGKKEMPYLPDARKAFEMTLLRMATFYPLSNAPANTGTQSATAGASGGANQTMRPVAGSSAASSTAHAGGASQAMRPVAGSSAASSTAHAGGASQAMRPAAGQQQPSAERATAKEASQPEQAHSEQTPAIAATAQPTSPTPQNNGKLLSFIHGLDKRQKIIADVGLFGLYVCKVAEFTMRTLGQLLMKIAKALRACFGGSLRVHFEQSEKALCQTRPAAGQQQPSAERATAKEASQPERAHPEQAYSDKTYPEQAQPEQTYPNKTYPEQAHLEQTPAIAAAAKSPDSEPLIEAANTGTQSATAGASGGASQTMRPAASASDADADQEADVFLRVIPQYPDASASGTDADQQAGGASQAMRPAAASSTAHAGGASQTMRPAASASDADADQKADVFLRVIPQYPDASASGTDADQQAGGASQAMRPAAGSSAASSTAHAGGANQTMRPAAGQQQPSAERATAKEASQPEQTYPEQAHSEQTYPNKAYPEQAHLEQTPAIAATAKPLGSEPLIETANTGTQSATAGASGGASQTMRPAASASDADADQEADVFLRVIPQYPDASASGTDADQQAGGANQTMQPAAGQQQPSAERATAKEASQPEQTYPDKTYPEQTPAIAATAKPTSPTPQNNDKLLSFIRDLDKRRTIIADVGLSDLYVCKVAEFIMRTPGQLLMLLEKDDWPLLTESGKVKIAEALRACFGGSLQVHFEQSEKALCQTLAVQDEARKAESDHHYEQAMQEDKVARILRQYFDARFASSANTNTP